MYQGAPPEIFADLSGKEGKEERENGEEKKEDLKGKRWKIGNGRGKRTKNEQKIFFFFFFFLLVTF